MPQDYETLEQIEAQLKAANLDQYIKPVAKGAAFAQQDLAGQLANVCGYYRNFKFVLDIILKIPFLSKSIKDALKKFMDLMDAICPAK